MSVHIGGSGKNPDLAEAIEKLIERLPAVEIHHGTTPPENPVEGDVWFNTEEERLYVYREE